MTSIPQLNAHQTRLLRMHSQRLIPDLQAVEESPDGLLEEIVGVQAQNLGAGRLSMLARSPGLSLEAMEQTRQIEHTIVWGWFMRGTLHLVSARDARWLVPLFAEERIRGDRGRMKQLGWDEAGARRGLDIVRDAIEVGPKTAAEIAHLLKEAGLPHAGQAPVHLLYRAAFEGLLCRGPDRGKTPTYAPFSQMAGELTPLPRLEALANLARRYLQAYAPAGPQDFSTWAGLRLGEARQAWELLSGEIAEVQAAGDAAWMPAGRLTWLDEPTDGLPLLRLLPMFDTYLLGYASRHLMMDDASRPLILKNGIIAATIILDGRAAGMWEMQASKSRLLVSLNFFEKPDGSLLPQAEREAAGLGEFLGLEAEVRLSPG